MPGYLADASALIVQVEGQVPAAVRIPLADAAVHRNVPTGSYFYLVSYLSMVGPLIPSRSCRDTVACTNPASTH